MAKISWKKEVLNNILNEKQKALIAAGFQIESYIKKSMTSTSGGGKLHIPSAPGQPPAVDTGRLRASISTNWSDSGMARGKVDAKAKEYDGTAQPSGTQLTIAKGDKFKVVVGTNVEYGCIFGAHTSITTDKGSNIISLIQEGDKVLTQTGDYKKVLKVIKKKALLTPNMITFEISYRKDKTHKLTVTEDHKILIFRGGRNKWVQAKDILITDKFFSRKKIEKMKGISKYAPNQCLQCGIEIKSKNGIKPNKYCSMEHKQLYYKENNCHPTTNSKRTKESRIKMSEAARKRNKEKPKTHANYIMAQKGYETSTEKQVYAWLKNSRKLKLIIEKQYPINGYFVDFYVPAKKEIYEADGSYWHQDQSKDIKRDINILKYDPDLKITHIHFYNERFSPKNMISRPLPNVNYVMCNPNVNSFVNLDIFETKDILNIKKWIYGEGKLKSKNGSWHGHVYDLMVEDIHSYYANGILVSNSSLEFGSSRMAPRPFMRPAFDLFNSKITKMLAKL